MRNVSVVDPKQDRLREQNNGRAWRDCATVGLGHLWAAGVVVGDVTYWRCRRCPVNTRSLTENGRPERWAA